MSKWISDSALFALVLALPASTAAASLNHVASVKVSAHPTPNGGAGTDIMIATSEAARYSARLTDGGRRLLVDISDADVTFEDSGQSDRTGVVASVLTQAFRSANSSVVRVAVNLAEPVTYRIRPGQGGLVLSLAPEGAGDKTASARNEATPPAPSASRIQDIRFVHTKSADTVTIDLSAASEFTLSNGVQGKSRVEVRGSSLPKELERTLDLSSASTRVRAVSAYKSGDKVILEADRANDVAARVTAEGTSLVWTFSRPGDANSSDTGVGPDGGAARKTRTVAREPAVLGIPAVETTWTEGGPARGAEGAVVRPRSGDAITETRSAPAEAGAFLPALAAQAQGAPAPGQGRFTGRRIDLDLKDADIHNVLRLLADVGRVNVITADNVAGAVTIRMRNVPWDQALEVVLQSKALGMVRQGNLLRVAPLAELEKEREMAIARRKQELELAPVETRLVPVSYATAAEIQSRAREMLSSRGHIAVDDRTNVLIVRDVAGNLNQVEELVRSLDTQTPQVLVEARIVEATSRYLRDVGIQWGGDATFSPATGNPTGLAFPSAVGVTGGATDAQTPTAGLSPFDRTVANPNFAVNLPAAVGTGSGGAIGLTLGSINNTVNLGVRLSAAESTGMLRIISSPRILTMDNKDARISQGTLIPFAQVSAQGVQTTFQEAKLQLLVRPHVTADGSVSMHVKVNRDEPDFNQTSPRGDPTILKREAETDLLIMDGHTAVIGGIYTRNTGRNVDQVPFFGDIPLLGLLFQRRRASDSRGELVIFLTPRIVNRAEALGR
ncbi:MAG TPA: type IV pilus secretin PilQ [Polyangiaceae bacterium]|nr:type IV pilus secretin PilQ [Polyangiaceae bacterium]